MKKHLPSAAVLSALLLVLCLHAAFLQQTPPGLGLRTLASSEPGCLYTQSSESAYTDYTAVIPAITASTSTASDLTVNGISMGHLAPTASVDGAAYVAAAPVLYTLYPGLSLTFQNGQLTAASTEVTFQAKEGDAYFRVNDRYFYAPGSLLVKDGQLMLPAAELSRALGCSLQVDGQTQAIALRQVGPDAVPGVYDKEDLYWLSRAIYAESGNQPMAGRIAVGTVILNRVVTPGFPDSVEEVIFAPRQFSPVANGTIYHMPDHESVIAAMLCLDGVKEADECLYFNVTSMRSWADKTRTLYCTIGDHNFYL